MNIQRNDAAKSVLVAYASGFGTTVGVAEAVAETARRAGWLVHLANMGEELQPETFDLVILGAPIRYDRWFVEARNFVRHHYAALSQTRTTAFFTCLTLSRSNQASHDQAELYARKITALLPGTDAQRIGKFAGVLDFAKFPLVQRPIVWLLMAALRVREGDYRNWAAIEAWTRVQLEINLTSSESKP
ncbi:MAG: flavodoxin domain-containing protein [Alphaproteobacteria bacterium]